MSDQKLRCALIYRLGNGSPTLLAKYDHAGQYESTGGAGIYGNRDKSYGDAVAAIIENDPPTGLAESSSLAGFKVVQSDQHQVVYGSDADGICTYYSIISCSIVFVGLFPPFGLVFCCGRDLAILAMALY
jgi:hypothetical protein